ncbi:MAG: hypothetical protein RL701_6889 [Pseudomonadota bacterium]|jgi:hypothetical protein
MKAPPRLDRIRGLQALTDGIPFQMPVVSTEASALVAVFPIDYERARAAIPGREVHPFKLWNKALLVLTVIDYRKTSIGNYIEYSIAIACTHGAKAAPALLPGVFQQHYGTGQFVLDLPVSSEISVKGGKGIWGMPKHQAQLDFQTSDTKVSSQYDLDGKLVSYLEIERPQPWLPVNVGAANYCTFRGLLVKSYIYFQGKAGTRFFGSAKARFVLGDHPRAEVLKSLQIEPQPVFTAFIPEVHGKLDDYFESWLLVEDKLPTREPEGLESVVSLGLSQAWLPPPKARVPGVHD